MSKTYKAMYKCNLCGEIYDSGFRTGERNAIKTTHLMLSGLDYQPEHWNNSLPRKNIHYCGDESMGISDFVGWEKEKTKEETPLKEGEFPF